MVTSTNPDEMNESVQIIEPEEQGGDSPVEEPQPVEDSPSEEAVEQPVAQDGGGEPTSTSVASEPPPAQPPRPQADQAAIAELQQRRVAEQEQTWRQNVGRAALNYERQLQEAGYMPEQARDQAKRYVQQEQKFRKQDEEAANMVGYIQGRNMAAIHFLKKHGLANKQVLDDLAALQNTNSPAEMEKEAIRMKNDRAMRSEIAQLKQGRVPPQTFDNSQGAAEATTNQDRLLDAYLAGDRSEAAMRAARKLTLGS
ncbi:hypothetical protein CMI37_25995 [Candidatus Pacearchaeota archaeon]|nr:hypothetical protein [Candidatus Pacearchaeota archaeon]